MIPVTLSQVEAFSQINQRLQSAGVEKFSRSTLFELRKLYMKQFPQSRWLSGERLLYGQPVILYLYFLCRVHSNTQNFKLTEMVSGEVTKKLPVRFSQRFQSFSDVDSFFANQSQSNQAA